jgi:hypothetical protein
MKIPFKLLPQLFNTNFVTAEADINSTEAPISPGGASGTDDAASSAVVETSETVVDSPAGSATASDVATGTQLESEVDPLKDVPTIEELKALAEQKIPHAQNVLQLREAYEKVKPQLDEYKTLDPWKPIATTIGDPALAQSSYELVTAIHTPNPENPSGFTSRPFLEKLESESPGSVDQLFADTLSFQVPDERGNPSTVVRELVKSWGIDPDRFDDYRNIDKFRASGVVTADDLGKIPEKYHEAFKSMSQDAREDLLEIMATKPLVAEENLRNAQRALSTEKFEQEQLQRQKTAEEAAQAKFQSEVAQAIDQDIVTEIQAISDSVHQNLSSQFTFSSDATVNELEHTKILSVLGNLQSPYPVYRDMAVKALKAVGVEPNGFEELANRLSERREAYVRFNAMGDKMQATRALSEATFAKQQILAKVNDYAVRLAKASGERAATAAAAQGSQLERAQARFVPSGAGQVQQGAQNPYANNPHPVGTQEYYAWYRQIDKANNLTNASVFGG